MQQIDLDLLNIHNLTSLWEKMGASESLEYKMPGLNLSHTWPNRVWFPWQTSAAQLAAIEPVLSQLPRRAVIPVWTAVGDAAVQLEKYLLANHFQISFQQLAMYLNLEGQASYPTPSLDIVKVTSDAALQAWVSTASAAFGYWIDSAAIEKLLLEKDVILLLAKENEQPIGTGLLYSTGEVLGAHLVGVPEAYRGRGIARAIMHCIINRSLELGAKFLTLQASAAGEPLYRQLGFVPQFAIKNYYRPEDSANV